MAKAKSVACWICGHVQTRKTAKNVDHECKACGQVILGRRRVHASEGLWAHNLWFSSRGFAVDVERWQASLEKRLAELRSGEAVPLNHDLPEHPELGEEIPRLEHAAKVAKNLHLIQTVDSVCCQPATAITPACRINYVYG